MSYNDRVLFQTKMFMMADKELLSYETFVLGLKSHWLNVNIK